MSATNDSVSAPLAAARQSLDIACANLDAAMYALIDVDGDDVMATPGIVALLLSVVAARRHLKVVELGVTTELRNSLRAATFS